MKDDLGNRMKRHELAHDHVLTLDLPLMVRIDGRAFHTFTRRLEKPFDENFSNAMIDATVELLKNFSGARGAYLQSDEASLLFVNESEDGKDSFFNYRIQKICSVFASLFATVFSKSLSEKIGDVPPVAFDCRCFLLPSTSEVVNNMIWRQKDCIKNGVTTALYHLLVKSGKGRGSADAVMRGMDSGEKIAYMKDEFSIDFHDAYEKRYLRGVFVKRFTIEKLVEDAMPLEEYKKQLEAGTVKPGQKYTRNTWLPDFHVPMFWEDRGYIEQLLEKEGK